MSRVYKKRIEDIHYKLLSNLDKIIALQSTIFQKSQKENLEIFKQLNNEMKSNFVKFKRDANKQYTETFFINDRLLEYIISEYSLLSLIFTAHFDGKKISRKKISDTKEKKLLFNIISLLLINAVNTLIAIRRLLMDGLCYQADVLFRTFIEIAEIIYCCLADENFFNLYRKEAKDKKEEKEIWYQTRPKNTVKIVENIFKDIEPSGKLWDVVFAVRNQLYEVYSGNVHGKFPSTAIGSYSETLKNRDILIPTFGGRISGSVGTTLENIITYSKLMINYLPVLIVKYHNTPFNKFGKYGRWFVYMNKMNTELFQFYSGLFNGKNL